MKVRPGKAAACATIVALFACALAGAMQPATMAAGSNVSVSFNLASQTTLVPTLCATGAAGRTDFGTVLPATKVVTSADCRIEFGSTNDTARLMLTQTDREGQALWGGEATGAPEATFDGGDGWRVHSMVAASDEAAFDAVMQDGRGMVTAGRQFVPGFGEEFSVSRYLSDGSLDPTFGNAGNTRRAVGPYDYASAVALAPDGTIVVAGMHDGTHLVLLRLDADGDIVTTWGTGGSVLHDLQPGAEEEPLDIAVLADGSIVVAGWINTANADAYAAKFQPNGSIDGGFGVGGMRRIDIDGDRDLAWRMAMQADGKILLSGIGKDMTFNEDDLFVARLTTTGNLDTATFGGGDGIFTYDSGAAQEHDRGSGIAVLPDGRIVAGGTTPGAGGWDLLVLRLLTNGTLDPSFGAGGVLTRHDGSGTEDATDIDVLPDGGLAVLGSRGSGNGAIQTWRLRANGSTDPTFSGDGYAETVITGYTAIDAREQVIGPDGSIMFAGAARNTDPNTDYLVGRLDSTTIPDYAAGRWTSSSPLFGGCLRDATNATPTWLEDPNLACTAIDGDPWYPIARLGTDTSAEVARAASAVDDAIVDLRFGVLVAGTQRPGGLVAPVTFEVIAPA